MKLTIDTEADAGYVSISQGAVARTEPFGESVLIDVDEAQRLVGIEILSLTAVVDVDGICERYDLSDDIRAELRRVLGREST